MWLYVGYTLAAAIACTALTPYVSRDRLWTFCYRTLAFFIILFWYLLFFSH